MTILPQMPSKSRDANRWKQYVRELEDLPEGLPGLSEALVEARRQYKQKEEEEASEG